MSNYFISEDPTVVTYLKDLKREDRRTKWRPDETLVPLAQAGNRAAFDELVKKHLKFVVFGAKEYTSSGIPLPDLISEGNIGLMKAVNNYDLTRGTVFITYAVWWVRQSILQHITDHKRLIRLPSSVQRDMKKNPEVVDTLPYTVSLHAPADSGEDAPELLDIIANEDAERPDAALDKEGSLIHLMDFINRLPARESFVIRKFFGIGCPNIYLNEIGEDLGVTTEGARQIKQKALRRLRQFAFELDEPLL